MNNGRVEFTFLWFIENYSYCWHRHGYKISSPYFTADELGGTTWRLELYPRGYIDMEDKGYISLFLRRSEDDDGPENITIKYELSILALEDKTMMLSHIRSYNRSASFGWGQVLNLDVISSHRKTNYLPQDCLTVSCRMWIGEGNVLKVEPICARTRIAIENFSFWHVVDNFSSLQSNQKRTVEIRSNTNKECSISSSLYFTDDSCSEGKMTVEVMPSDDSYILCRRKISLLCESGNLIGCGENDNRLDVERKDIQKLPLSLTRQAILNKSEYLRNGKLYLLCECAFSTGLEFEKLIEIRQELPTAVVKSKKYVYKTAEKLSAYASISEDLKCFYDNKCLTDVELKTKTKSFPAHKVVLCARSPVFKTMMTNEMKEKYNSCIEVVDLEDDIVQQLLLFLYSDNTENLHWDTATKLYYAADKYEIGKLKIVCSSFLVGNVTISNVTELLLLADMHNDSDLMEVVEDFILEHEQQIFGSKEWEKLIETHPLLVIKTMHLKYKRKNEVN